MAGRTGGTRHWAADPRPRCPTLCAMTDQHVGRGSRLGAIGLVVALAAAACSGSETSQERRGNDPATMVATALGGPQAVQDFLIHLDMQVETDAGYVSYYDDVLDHAAAGAGEPLALNDGLSFSAVTSLEGHMTDPDGELLPTVSLDFGLLSGTPEGAEASRADLAAEFAAAGDTVASDLIASAEVEGSRVLVELVTADYASQRTHAALGDRGAVDLTFVESIGPGDAVKSIYVFGQTLPGDPAIEATLSAHQLFAYRWNEGLFDILGADNGPFAVVDDSVRLVKGSTVREQESKAVLAGALGAAQGRRTAIQILLNQGCVKLSGRPVTCVVPHGDYVAFGEGGEYPRTIGTMPITRYLSVSMMLGGRKWCSLHLARMLAENDAAARKAPAPDAEQTSTTPQPTATVDETPEPDDRFGDRARELCPKPVPFGPVGGTFGDVHVTTFDGWSYDNQASGEFLVFDNGAATVQMRLEPWEESDAVSVVTGVAVGVGDHEVSMHQGGRLWIDGKEPELRRGESISVGDAALVWTGTGWFIVWPDGTQVRVTGGQRDPYADSATPRYSNLVVLVYPSDQAAVGMFGSADGDGANDWVTRSGEQLDSEIRYDFDAFYPTYVDTWRISQDESLFHYEQGQSTDTFTIDGFPRVRYDVADLDPTVVADAEAACREGGVERAEVLVACTLDVALTGDYRFVFDAYVVESSTSSPVEAGPEPTAGPTPVTGENAVTVGPLSVVFGAEPPSALANSAVQWQCQASEGSMLVTSRFQQSQDQSFRLTIEYLDAARSDTGHERFTMIIERNSKPTAWTQTTVDPMAGSLDSVTLEGSTLIASGTALFNDPPDPALFPGSGAPPGTKFEPFSLHVDCAA